MVRKSGHLRWETKDSDWQPPEVIRDSDVSDDEEYLFSNAGGEDDADDADEESNDEGSDQ